MKSSNAKKINLSFKRVSITLSVIFMLIAPGQAYATGTYSSGKMIVRVTKFESSGYIKSYEGIFEYADYDSGESCNAAENFCFTPKLETREFSVRDENKQLAHFINQNVGKEMVIEYRKHRLAPVGLATDFEVTAVTYRKDAVPADLPQRYAIEKTGSKRNFALYGNIIKLERSGTTYKSWEGLYYDRQRDVIHPFSLTDDAMAQQIMRMMEITKDFHFGISQARYSLWKQTSYDIFEVNYTKKPDTL
jgi:hypothetical protein